MAAKSITLPINEYLINQIEIKAKAEGISLNDYIESLLLKDLGKMPNRETHDAIIEVMSAKKLEEIRDVDVFMDSI